MVRMNDQVRPTPMPTAWKTVSAFCSFVSGISMTPRSTSGHVGSSTAVMGISSGSSVPLRHTLTFTSGVSLACRAAKKFAHSS